MTRNGEIFIKNIPDIQEREFKYRTRMESHVLNELQDEAFKDILDLFNRANQMQKAIYELSTVSAIENEAYTEMLLTSQYNLNIMTEMYENLSKKPSEFHYQTQYGYQAYISKDIEDYGAVISAATNDITAGIMSSVSKTRMYDATYDELLIPPDLQVYIGPDSFQVGGDIIAIEDSDINKAFDGDMSSVWFRKVTTAPSVTEIENEVVIALPENIITTRQINEIVIKPFPAGWIDIIDIRYKANGAWQTIPGFTQHYGCAVEEYNDIFANVYNKNIIIDCPDVKFNFKDIETNQLKIKLRQRHYKYDAAKNMNIFYLGLRDVDIVYNVYSKDSTEFCMDFSFPEIDRNIQVHDVELYFNNSNAINDTNFGVHKEYFYYDGTGNYHKIKNSCPFQLEGHKMRVKFTIEGSQETPNIHMAKAKYKLV